MSGTIPIKQSTSVRVAMDNHTATPLPDNCTCKQIVGDSATCPIPEHSATYSRRRAATDRTIRRIAELTIKAHGLNCTVDEYITKMHTQGV